MIIILQTARTTQIVQTAQILQTVQIVQTVQILQIAQTVMAVLVEHLEAKHQVARHRL